MKTMKNKSATSHRFSWTLSALSFFCALLAAPSLHATSATWTGTGGTTNWATLGNWSGPPASVPGNNETATFNSAGNGNTTISVGTLGNIGAVIFDTSSAAAYTIGSSSGETMNPNRGGNITVNSGVTANQTFAAKIILPSNSGGSTAVTIANNGTGSLNFGVIDRTGNNLQATILTGSGNINVGQFTRSTGTGAPNNNAVTKTGTGTLTLTGASTTGGTITISDGTLQIGNGGTTGRLTAITNITDNANLTINRSDAFSQATDLGAGVAITGTGSFTQAGAGTTTLTAANTYSGTTTISAGTLQIGNGGTTGRLTATTAIDNNANLTINRSDAFSQATDLGAGVAITGTGSFTKTGTGTTTLTAVNTYTGTTTVSNGVLNVTGSLAAGSAVTVDGTAGGKLGGSGTINGTVKLQNGGTIQPSTSGGVNTLTFANSTAPTYSSSGSTLKLRVNGTSLDQVNFSAAPAHSLANLDLVLDLAAISGAVSGATIYSVASGNLSSEAFKSVTLINNSGGYSATVHYNTTTITVDLLTGAGPVDAAHSTISPPTATQFADGVSTQVITVQARDASNNNRTSGGDTVVFSATAGTVSATTDNGNGTYTATWTAPTSVGSGTATVTATLGGTDIGTAVSASSSVITLNLEVRGPLTWDITDTTDQTIDDGNGTWNTSNALWNNATSNNANVAWNNTANANDTAVIGAGGAGGMITVGEAISLAGLTFNEVTSPFTLSGSSFTAPGGTLTIQNNDTSTAGRRTSTGALIGSLLTGNMNVVFAGAGDNVGLTNAANDFVGEIRLSGGGLSIASNGTLGNSANALAVLGASSNLRNTSPITMNRNLVFSAGAGLSIVNSGNILTLAGNISGGDSASTLTIGAGHGNSYNHTVRITGTNTMAGTIRIYNVLRAYEGVGLSTNANIKLGDYLDFSGGYANTCGFLETSGDFTRALGAGANQFQWESTGNYMSGGFSAVGDVLTINFGGLSTPSSLTWNSTTGFLKTDGELRLQNANATHDLIWKNPVSLGNNQVRVIYANSSTYPAIMEGVLSGTGSSGFSKEGVGILHLTATNTYAGVTTIAAGTLQIGNGGTTGTLGAGIVANNAKLVVNRSNAYNLTNLIVGTGTFLKRGEGTLTLSATNTYSGLTTVSNGTLAAGCDLALKADNALTLSGGTFDAGSFSNSLGTLTLSTGSTNILAVNTGTCQLSFSGLSGAGTLTITGTLGPTTLRFGTSSTALTPEQRAQITTANGRKIGLDANGYVFAIPLGTQISFF